MSVAIVAMVNHTAIEASGSDHDEPIDTECGTDIRPVILVFKFFFDIFYFFLGKYIS